VALPSSKAYHTVVVGAGPAGILAALHAAEVGSVLLVEQSSLPRSKSCGGMLHHHTLRTLAEYGSVPDSIVLSPSHVNFRYHDWDRAILRATSLEFLNVDRAGFDAWLLGLLPDGVEVVAGCAIKDLEQTDDRVSALLKSGGGTATVECVHLIGADGARSQVRRSLGVASTATYVTIQDFVQLSGPLEPYFDCIYLRDIGDAFGYAYVVPKGEVAIVGSVFYPKTKRPGEKHDAVLAVLRQALPALGPSVAREAAAALSVRSAEDVVPGRGRVLLAGEAGGFMSPTSGEGISYAINSGRAAGLAVAAGDASSALQAYTRGVAPIAANIARKLRWLPFMESRMGKYFAGFVPAPIVSKVTEGL
jgi:flavin-dependent dehydrogenase